jgi:hypothetical protein
MRNVARGEPTASRAWALLRLPWSSWPPLFLAVVRALLTDRPLPIASWSGSGVPADYEGPEGQLPVPGRR